MSENVTPPNDAALRTAAEAHFRNYLIEHRHRKTPERFAILAAIYSHRGHFTIQELDEAMCAKKYQVSRATLYNTLDLLVRAQLVTKLQFGSGEPLYERAFGTAPHEHLVCLRCGRVTEMDSAVDTDAIQAAAKAQNFLTIYHALHVYGLCPECQAREQSEEKARK